MGMMNQLMGQALSRFVPGGRNPLVRAALQLVTSSGGIGGLQQRFQSQGLGSVADSWISNGPNQPIDPNQLSRAFDRRQIEEASQKSGLPEQDLMQQLSSFLPNFVNGMTPEGHLPQRQPGMTDMLRMAASLLGKSRGFSR